MKQMFRNKGIFKMILCLILVFSMVIPNVSMVAMADEGGKVTTGGGYTLTLDGNPLKITEEGGVKVITLDKQKFKDNHQFKLDYKLEGFEEKYGKPYEQGIYADMAIYLPKPLISGQVKYPIDVNDHSKWSIKRGGNMQAVKARTSDQPGEFLGNGVETLRFWTCRTTNEDTLSFYFRWFEPTVPSSVNGKMPIESMDGKVMPMIIEVPTGKWDVTQLDYYLIKWEEPKPEEEAGTYIYFKAKDGKITKVGDDGIIELKCSDEGNFYINGELDPKEKITDVEFHSKEVLKDEFGRTYYHFWVGGEYSNEAYVDGALRSFNPRGNGERKIPVTFKQNGVKKSLEFTIKIIPTDISDIEVYVGDKKLTDQDVLKVKGSEWTTIKVKGKSKGDNEFVELSRNAYEVKYVNDFVHIQGNRFSLWKHDKEHTLDVHMIDNPEVKKIIKVTSSFVGVEDIEVMLPQRWPIHSWNVMGNRLNGLRNAQLLTNENSVFNPEDLKRGYVVRYKPNNPSYLELKWEALTPEIATFEDLHDQGIVPKKAGVAKFKVSSVSNPKIAKEVEVEFYYKNPLTAVKLINDKLTIKPGEEKNLEIAATPSNASEQRFVWTYDKAGIVEITDKVNVNPDDVHAEKSTSHIIKGLRAGTVKVKGTPIDTTGGAKPLEFTVSVEGGPAISGGGAVIAPKDDTKKDNTQKDDTKKDDAKKDDSKKDDAKQTAATPKPSGTKLKDSSGVSYEVTSARKKAPAVAYTAAPKKAKKTVTIPKTVTVDGTKYKVTSIEENAFAKNKTVKQIIVSQNITTIGASAFADCPKLKKITINSTKLTAKNVADDAFADIADGTVIRVPKKMLGRYQKLFAKKGLSKKVKVVAIKSKD